MRLAAALVICSAGLSAGVHFEPNHGQAPARLEFTARSRNGILGVGGRQMELLRGNGSRLVVTLEGAAAHPRATPIGRLPGVSHYVMGRDPAKWNWGVEHFANVRFHQIYSGIDILYKSRADNLEFDFLLAAGADPARILLRLSEPLTVAQSGELQVGGTRLHAPLAWQEKGGVRTPVEVHFTALDSHRVAFQLGRYDRSLPLTIDPIVEFATFLGGSNNEGDTRIATSPDGAIYMAGTTSSPDFPADPAPGSVLNHVGNLLSTDVYVARLKADASTLEWSLFLGGNGWEAAQALKCDSLGNVYFLGATTSPNFPVTAGAYRTKIVPELADLVLVKFDGATGRLKASSFLGAQQYAEFNGTIARLAVDPAGGLYVTGSVVGDRFSTTPGALQPKAASPSYRSIHGFIMRLNSAITARVYATFFDSGSITAMDVDGSGGVIAGGLADNPFQAFPSVNPIPGVNQTPARPAQAFVARLNPSGSAMTFASLLHGDGEGSSIMDIKADGDGSIHVVGWSAGTAFPQVNPLSLEPLPPGYQETGQSAPFLSTIPSGGGGLVQSTLFLGPEYMSAYYSTNYAMRLQLKASGKPCVLGLGAALMRQTPGGLLPETGSGTGRLACVDDEGKALQMKTGLPYGANPTELAIAADGAVLVVGTAYLNFETTKGVVQPAYGGGSYPRLHYRYGLPEGDAFLLRLSLANPAPVIQTVTPESILLETGLSGTRRLDLYGSGFAFATALTMGGGEFKSELVDGSHLRMTEVPFEALKPGPNRITASLPGPGGGSSEAVVTGIYPTPSRLTVSPSLVAQNVEETKVVIRADNITPESVLYWNGVPRGAQYVRAVQGRTGSLELIIGKDELAKVAVSSVAVSNPAPGGGLSGEATFVVQPASGPQVPVLQANLAPLLFTDSAPAGPKVAIGGSGFSDATRANWDGVDLPVEFISAARINIQPPSEDLNRWGAHNLYLRNGDFRSAVARVFIVRSLRALAWETDPIQRRLYVLTESLSYDGNSDLAILDLEGGRTLAVVKTAISNATSLAVSDSGKYVYLAGTVDAKATIRRYNSETGAVDLEWQPETPSGRKLPHPLMLLAVPNSDETIVVTSGDSRAPVAIYDRDVPRFQDSFAAGFQGGQAPVFATSTRIYLNKPSPGCWQWLDYDSSGVTGGAPGCQAQLPNDVVSDSGLVYLTDGRRILTVAVPGRSLADVSYEPVAFAADPAQRRAYQLIGGTYPRLTEFKLDSQEQPDRPLPSGYYYQRRLFQIPGGLLQATSAWIAFLP